MSRGRTVFVGAVALVAAGAATWFYVGRAGESTLERWIGQYLRGVIQAHLEPQLVLGGLDYQAPYTVEITDLQLRFEELTLLSVPRASLTLAELPRPGQPIKVARVELDRPALHLAADPEGGFRGWSNALKVGLDNYEQQVPEGKKLSDVLRLEHVALDNAELRYSTATDDPDLIVTGLNAALESPTGAEVGTHQLDGSFNWSDLLKLTLAGTLNLDASRLDLTELKLAGNLTPDDYRTLPPQVQTLLAKYPLEAHVTVLLSGTFLLDDPAASTADLTVAAQDCTLQTPHASIPDAAAEFTGKLHDRRATFGLRAQALGGGITGGGSANLADEPAFRANLRIADIDLSQADRGDEEHNYAGIVNLTAEVAAPFAELPAALDGPLELTVTQARLVVIPLIQQIRNTLEIDGALQQVEPKDEVHVSGRIRADHLFIERADYLGPLIGARAKGKVFYDQTLDLLVNAGPLQRLEKALGAVGDALASLTGKVAPLHVTGPIAEPSVTVKPLGFSLP